METGGRSSKEEGITEGFLCLLKCVGFSPPFPVHTGVGTSYYAVAVVRANSSLTINHLKGARTCHTGINRTAGWNIPIGFLIDSGRLAMMGCQVLRGDEHHPWALAKLSTIMALLKARCCCSVVVVHVPKVASYIDTKQSRGESAALHEMSSGPTGIHFGEL